MYNVPEVVGPPPQSPDMNPIENLRRELDLRVHMTRVANIAELRTRLTEEWAITSAETTQKYVTNMPECLQSVLLSRGYPTKY